MSEGVIILGCFLLIFGGLGVLIRGDIKREREVAAQERACVLAGGVNVRVSGSLLCADGKTIQFITPSNP